MPDAPPMEILLSEQQIQKRVAELAADIRRDCPDDVHLVAVLKGAFVFLSDLVRHMRGSVTLDFIAVSSYAKARTSSGEVRMLKDLDTRARRPQRDHRRRHRGYGSDTDLPPGYPAGPQSRGRSARRVC